MRFDAAVKRAADVDPQADPAAAAQLLEDISREVAAQFSVPTRAFECRTFKQSSKVSEGEQRF